MKYFNKGTVGVVKKCIEKKTKNIYAVKIVNTRDEEVIGNIKKEFLHLKDLSHRNIIEVHQLLIDNMSGIVYLVLEYFDGEEMFKYLSRCGKYTEKTAKYLFS